MSLFVLAARTYIYDAWLPVPPLLMSSIDVDGQISIAAYVFNHFVEQNISRRRSFSVFSNKTRQMFYNRGCVLERAITEDHNDDIPRLIWHQFKGARKRHARTWTGDDTLLTIQTKTEVKRFLIGHLDQAVVLIVKKQFGLL